MNLKRLASPELFVGLALFLGCFAGSALLQIEANRTPGQHLAPQHLGAEYFNIARALVDGRGFSDPFGEATGPTAWMPPLYPLLLAGLIEVLGARPRVAAAVMVLGYLSLALGGMTVYRLASERGSRVGAWLAVALYAAAVLVFGDWLLLLTHDGWLVLALIAVMTRLLFTLTRGGDVPVVRWALITGVTALSTPTLLAAWSLVSGWLALRRPNLRRRLLIAVALGYLAMVPWTVRNYLVFERVIPLKSNLYFDAYQANLLDSDGVYDADGLVSHPFVSYDMRFRYAALGEARFTDHFKRQFLAAVRERPAALVWRVTNRLRAATVKYSPFFAIERRTTAHLRQLYIPLMFALSLAGLFAARRERGVYGLLFALACAYLAPYVLLAYYLRYYLPLLPIQILLAHRGLEWAVTTAAPRVRPPLARLARELRRLRARSVPS